MLSIDSLGFFGFNERNKMAQTLLLVGKNKKELKISAEKLSLEQSSTFDTLFFDASENKGIESTREIITTSFRKPFNSRILTLIVLEADKLTVEAQNSLLKLLEEPPNETQIILTTNNRNSLIPTVVSRCLEIDLLKSEELSSPTAFEGFLEKPFGERLEILEKNQVEQYLLFLQKLLHQKISLNESSLENKASQITKRLRIALKLHKASKSFANKKLIALLLAQS